MKKPEEIINVLSDSDRTTIMATIHAAEEVLRHSDAFRFLVPHMPRKVVEHILNEAKEAGWDVREDGEHAYISRVAPVASLTDDEVQPH